MYVWPWGCATQGTNRNPKRHDNLGDGRVMICRDYPRGVEIWVRSCLSRTTGVRVQAPEAQACGDKGPRLTRFVTGTMFGVLCESFVDRSLEKQSSSSGPTLPFWLALTATPRRVETRRAVFIQSLFGNSRRRQPLRPFGMCGYLW